MKPEIAIPLTFLAPLAALTLGILQATGKLKSIVWMLPLFYCALGTLFLWAVIGIITSRKRERPRVCPIRFTRLGLQISNDSDEIARDVQIPPIDAGRFTLVIQCALLRLIRNEEPTLCQTWIDLGPGAHRSADSLFSTMQAEGITEIPVRVSYTGDDGKRGFRTSFKLSVDMTSSGGIDIKDVKFH